MDITDFVVIIVIAVVALGSWFIWDKRYKGNQSKHTRAPEGYEPTDEAFIDPTNNKKYKVYYNPQTGERFYQEMQ